MTTRDPTRVVMIVRLFDPWKGGMERQAHTLASALVRSGHEVRILTGRWFRRTQRRQTYDGVQVVRHGALLDGLGIRGLRRVAAVAYMITLLTALFRYRRTYDVIHVHGLSYHAYVAVRFGRQFGKPVIVKLANSGRASDILKMKAGQHLFLSRYLLPTALKADRFVALNDTIREELVAEGVPPERIVEIPNGVSVPEEPPSLAKTVSERVVAYVGRLHEQKAVDVLIRGFIALPRPVKERTRLRIIGDGPARPDLEELVEKLSDNGEVEFVGEVDDIDQSLRRADLVVLPSLAEGMSNTLLEAMARGVPVMASDIPANAVLVESGENGWLFPASDWKSLAALLVTVLEDNDLLQEVGAHARRQVAERYGIDRVALRYAELYRDVCGTGP
jgi:L-malate glycosyltransferase